MRSFKDKTFILFSVFLVSISLFVYQIILTRIYSALFWYHYVFLITSYAIFGLGIGSIIAYRSQNKKKAKANTANAGRVKDNERSLYLAVLVLAACYMLVLALLYLLPFVNSIIIYAVLGTVPFVVAGYFFAILFRELPEISSRLYFADLVGSGLGSIIVLYLFNYAGIFRAALIIAILAAVAALFIAIALRRRSVAAVVLPVILIAGLFIPGKYVYLIEQNFNGFVTNNEKTLGSLRKTGKEPRILYTEWNAFSRTDVIEAEENSERMVVTIDGAANAPMFKYDGTREGLDKFKRDSEFIPFSFGNNDSTLIIGPGGGRDLLYALAAGSSNITAVEINASSIEAVNKFKDYNGDIYNRPEVKIFEGDGRNFVRRSKDKYDTIFLSVVMTNASQGAGYALTENYIYTVEAVQEYLDHLNENGKIAFLSHDEQDLGKLVATAVTALNKRGIEIKDAPRYLAVIAEKMPGTSHSQGHVHYPTVIIKNKPFTEEESKKLIEKTIENNNNPLFIPFVMEEGPLQKIMRGEVSLLQYLNGFNYKVTPATDDNPYFYNANKGVSPILFLVLILSLMASLILFTPFAVKGGYIKPMFYFGLLGAGFMMIEIPFIQKFILYLGHPVLAFNYVLAALLIGGGLGSFLSGNKLFNRVFKGIYIPPLMAVIINVILLAVMGVIFRSTSHLNIEARIIISALLVAVQGFFMGMPFPRGIKLLGETGRESAIPVMWGVNGVMSIGGSVLSVIISMQLGFTAALVAGGILYIMVSLRSNI